MLFRKSNNIIFFTSYTVGTIMKKADPLTCAICDSGQYNDDAPLNITQKCKDCPTGRYITDEKSDRLEHDSIDDCKICTPGLFFVSSISYCHICPSGFYRMNDGIVCVECPTARYIIDKAKSAVLHDEINDCKGCPIGYEFQGRSLECSICSSGRYQDENDSSDTVCKFCKTGKYNADDRKDLTKHDSIEDCTLCADGFFSNPGDSFCNVCPSGFITWKERIKNTTRSNLTIESNQTIDFNQTTELLTFCLPCLPGTMSTSPGLNNCTGKYIQEQEY